MRAPTSRFLPPRRYIVDYDEVLTRYRVVVHISSMGFVGQVLTDIMDKLKQKGERIDEVPALWISTI